ncbi:MAG: sigma-70 family RNA polymerase sigma factor [Phycisphaerae bacterium]|nr:sigma-70 family RNA polymerase sigma factor [Phycisphaerae bacterium]
MLPMTEPQSGSPVRKLEPKAKPPGADVLERLPEAERFLLERCLTETAECVYNPVFELTDAEQTLMGPPPSERAAERHAANDDSSVDVFAVTADNMLEIDDERHIFLRLNYARHRVYEILRQSKSQRLTGEVARDLLKWQHAVMNIRNEIVRMNVPLVLAMVKRMKITGVDFADLISEGNLALLRAVDKFDCARGFKFSTYACRSILKSFARVAARTARYRGHFPVEFDPTLEKGDAADRRRATIEEDCVEELKSILGQNGARLSPVEQTVINARFSLDIDGTEIPTDYKTLEQVGEMIGVTKERVRQIQNKALLKLRAVFESDALVARPVH